jgi:hypothetical protein
MVNSCKLCGQEKSLLRKSHIIPEFMYASLFDEHHKLNLFAPAQFAAGNRRIARPSSGEYESGILCQECDNELLGSLESYAYRSFYATDVDFSDKAIFEAGRTEMGIPLTRVTNVKYREFKLFLLSILWRASISTRPFFDEVHLGPYQEKVRQMLLTGDPGTQDLFPILLFSWEMDNTIPHEFTGKPGINRKEKGVRYIFPIAGVSYIFHVSPTSMIQELRPFTLIPTNEFSLLYIPPGKGRELFTSYFRIQARRSATSPATAPDTPV